MPAWCTFEIKVPPMALIPRRCSFCTMPDGVDPEAVQLLHHAAQRIDALRRGDLVAEVIGARVEACRSTCGVPRLLHRRQEWS